MATTEALVSLETYLRTSYQPDAEYVSGVLEQRAGERIHFALGELEALLD